MLWCGLGGPQNTGEAMDVVTWTPERVEQLTQLFEEGLPTAEIGRRLGLTKKAVIGQLDPLALVPRASTPAAPEALLRRSRGDRLCASQGGEGEGRLSPGACPLPSVGIRRNGSCEPQPRSTECQRGVRVPRLRCLRQRIARSMPSRVTGNMRSATMFRIIPMLAVPLQYFSGTGFSHTARG